MPKQKTLRLILGDQLNERHSWFQKPDKNVSFVLMEIRQETDYVAHHIQKVAAFFAAMRAFAKRLRGMEHQVIYLKLDDRQNHQTIVGNIGELLKGNKFSRFEYLQPDEFRLDLQLRELSESLPVPCEMLDSEHFLTGRMELEDFFAAKKRYLMESFYRWMRKRYDILMDGRKPVGDQWNFDQKNRHPYDGKVPVPEPLLFENNVSAICKTIRKAKVATIGEIKADRLIWPVSRDQALKLLKSFVTHFEESWRLFRCWHSCD